MWACLGRLDFVGFESIESARQRLALVPGSMHMDSWRMKTVRPGEADGGKFGILK